MKTSAKEFKDERQVGNKIFFFGEIGRRFCGGENRGPGKNRLRRSLLTIEDNRLFCLENGWENQEMPFGEN